MRPDLAHIDAADAQRKLAEAEAAGANAREAQALQPADQQQAVKAISVQYRKVDSERVQDIKRSSFAYLQDKLEREKWVDLDIKSRHVRPSISAMLLHLESVFGLQCHSSSFVLFLCIFGSALSILLSAFSWCLYECVRVRVQLDETQGVFEQLLCDSGESLHFEHSLSALMAICNPPVPDTTRSALYARLFFTACMSHSLACFLVNRYWRVPSTMFGV